MRAQTNILVKGGIMEVEKDIFMFFHSIMKKMKKIADDELVLERLTHREMRILLAIYYTGVSKQDEMVEYIDIDRSNISRSLKKLEEYGYILKKKNKTDMRSFSIVLTEKGKEIKNKIIEIRSNLKKVFGLDMSKEELKLLTVFLDRGDKSLNDINYARIKGE